MYVICDLGCLNRDLDTECLAFFPNFILPVLRRSKNVTMAVSKGGGG